MKKVLFTLLAAGAAFAAWRTFTKDDAERDLWAEVTDTVE
jgi:hypothetical protein